MKFQGILLCLDLSNSTPYKQKKSLVDLITSNGGRVSFILNSKVNYLVRDDTLNLDTYKCRTAFKLGIPILNSNYILDAIQSKSCSIENYIVKNKKIQDNLNKGIISSSSKPNFFSYHLTILSLLIIAFYTFIIKKRKQKKL